MQVNNYGTHFRRVSLVKNKIKSNSLRMLIIRIMNIPRPKNYKLAASVYIFWLFYIHSDVHFIGKYVQLYPQNLDNSIGWKARIASLFFLRQ